MNQLCWKPILTHMPDMYARESWTTSWITAGPIENVMNALMTGLLSYRLQVISQTTNQVVGVIGSRLALRILGFMTPVNKWPIKVQLDVAPSSEDGVRVEAVAVSDPGWYLARVGQLAARSYEKSFDELARRLHEAAPMSS